METTAPDYAYYTPSGNSNPKSREDTTESMKAFWEGFPAFTEYILNRGLLFLLIDNIYRAFSVDKNCKVKFMVL